MKTKYGNLPNQVIISSLDRLTGKVFKILPMREEDCRTLDEYVSNLIRELINTKSLIENLKFEGELLSLISTLEGLTDNDINLSVCKSDVFKSIDIIKKMVGNLKGGK
jgi:hypothetical protein